MAAAAACRSVALHGGSGHLPNRVYAVSRGRNCTVVCEQSEHKNCDGALSISGFIGKAKTDQQEVGWFYNYGCDRTPWGGNFEPSDNLDIIKVNHSYYTHYCCCRK